MLHLGDITRIHGAGVPAVEVVIGGEQEMYLRPETLFGTKFEGYLQDARRHGENSAESSFDGDAFYEAALARAYQGGEG